MFSPLRNRFGIPGVISVVALVFAMLGGAYAAQNNGGGKATVSAKAKKGPRGPKGATGPAGPAGAQGPAGPAGAAGAKGDAGSSGSAGSPGSPGAAGKSPKGTSFEGTDEPVGEPCEEAGGVEFKAEGSAEVNYACNGVNGAPGQPWTMGGTLPVGSTETGAFGFSWNPNSTAHTWGSVTFNVPLAHSLDSTHVAWMSPGVEQDPVHCTGTLEEPKAASGYLCVYGRPLGVEFFEINPPGGIVPFDPEGPGTLGAGTAGAILRFTPEEQAVTEERSVSTRGSFAVTG